MDAAPCGLAWKGGRMGVAWLCLFCACVDSRGRADEDRITKKRKGKKEEEWRRREGGGEEGGVGGHGRKKNGENRRRVKQKTQKT